MSIPSGMAAAGEIAGAAGDPLALAVSQAAFATIITDTSGTITYVNEAFVRLTGYSREEALGQQIAMLRCRAHGDAFYENLCNCLRSGSAWSDRMSVGRKDGSNFRSRTFASPVFGAGGEVAGYSFFSGDTSDEAKIESQLMHLQKMEAIGELASGIAHEINTPIQYIGDNIQFLREACGDVMRLLEAYADACGRARNAPLPESEFASLEAMRSELDWDFLKEEIPLAIDQALEGRDRVAAIVRAMKEFAHPGDEELAPVDVNHAIENTLAVSRGEWKNVAEVETDLDPMLPPVPCYPGSFNQVLVNLVVNAAHAVGDSRETRGGEKGLITLTSRACGDEVHVSVRDNGCGMPPEIIGRIFEPFYTTKDVGKGTGQGLALAHAVIVDQLKGHIEVESAPGKGTQFLLRLPLENTAGPRE